MKLSNSPLQEVVFEAYLEEQIDRTGLPTNEKYQFAQGLFHHKIKNDFPIHTTRNQDTNIRVYPSIQHQFWKNKNTWPVIQFGPGLMTVNDTEVNYEWNQFFPLIKNCMDVLYESYDNAVKINRLSLQYIDAIEFKTMDVSEQLNFINKNFKLNLTNNFQLPNSKQVKINIHQTFQLKEVGEVHFMISSGFSKNNLPSLIWQSQVVKELLGEDIEINNWVSKSHTVLSDLFKMTITKEFYDSFK